MAWNWTSGSFCLLYYFLAPFPQAIIPLKVNPVLSLPKQGSEPQIFLSFKLFSRTLPLNHNTSQNKASSLFDEAGEQTMGLFTFHLFSQTFPLNTVSPQFKADFLRFGRESSIYLFFKLFSQTLPRSHRVSLSQACTLFAEAGERAEIFLLLIYFLYLFHLATASL